MKINILHFSDLHYDSQDTRLSNLLEKTIKEINGKDIDFIIFSGDLLQKPSEHEFNNLLNNFIKPLLNIIKLDIEKCLFTLGNHDVDFNKRDDVVFDGLKTQIIEKKNKKIINELISNERKLLEVEDYINFIKNLEQKSLIENNPIFSINIINIKQISIGHVAINSSLFMQGSKEDFGNLYLDIDIFIEAHKKIKDTTIKIVNMHHPLDWFSNKKEIEKIILDKFNIVFFGHEHQHDGYHITDMYNKDIISLNATSMYHKKNEKNGFCIYRYEVDENKLLTCKYEFNKIHNHFETINLEAIENINLMKKAPKAIRNSHICSTIYPILKEHINKYLAINLTTETNNKDIEEIYIHPKIIKEKKENTDYNNQEEQIVSLDDIINYKENIIIAGKKESGKTTLLNILNIKYLKDYNDYIPIYIKGIEFYNDSNIDIFIAKIKNYLKDFYPNGKKINIDKMIEEERFIFLIDDIQNLSSQLIDEILKLNNRVIATFDKKIYDIQDKNLLNFDNDVIIEKNFIKLSIEPLRKKEKKQLTNNIVPKNLQDRISNKVIKTINKLRLPSNPFITTLLSWMYIEKIDIRENEPQIIDVFLDYLLEKADLSKTFNGKIDFNDKKDILSKIAHTYFINKTLALKEDKLRAIIIEYCDNHFAFDIDSQTILKYFYDRKILIKNNNLVQFSYRVFYYYFITLYMINNKDFYMTIVENKSFIVNMIDELRYYASLKRDDIPFVEKIETFLQSNRLQKEFLKLPKLQQSLIPANNDINDIDNLDNKLEIIEKNDNYIDEKIKTKLQEKFDDIETKTIEKKVEKYNQNDTLKIDKRKLPKEEFFVLSMIYAEFVKHLSGNTIEKEEKEKYFYTAIKEYINIIRYWEQTFKKEELLRRFFYAKFKEEKDIKEEEVNKFKNFIEFDVINMISYVAKITLSSPKMIQFYYQILENENSNIYEKFLILILTLDIENEQEKILNNIQNFIKYNDNNILDMILSTRLYELIVKNQLKSKQKNIVKKMLVELEYKIHKLNDDKFGIRKKELIEMVDKKIEFHKLIV